MHVNMNEKFVKKSKYNRRKGSLELVAMPYVVKISMTFIKFQAMINTIFMSTTVV